MALLLEDKNRKYQRIRFNATEKKQLLGNGLTPVVSSNVSGIAKDGKSLIVRFHGGATYEYPTSGSLYASMLNSGSKGKFVWNKLRRAGVPYKRISNIPMKYDERITDRNLMEEVDVKRINADRIKTQETIDIMESIFGKGKISTNVNLSLLKDLNKDLYTKVNEISKVTKVVKKVKGINPLLATTILQPKDVAIGIITALVVSDILKEHDLNRG